jgi:hypothetical protein
MVSHICAWSRIETVVGSSRKISGGDMMRLAARSGGGAAAGDPVAAAVSEVPSRSPARVGHR